MALRFAGFELNILRAELRGPDGALIKLRPKTLVMLDLFASNAGRVLTKQELLDAVWPNVHVGDDSLFQCIREIRTALGDDERQMIKLVSGRGYLFDAEVSVEPAAERAPAPGNAHATARPAAPWWPGLASPLALASIGASIAGLIIAVVVTGRGPSLIAGSGLPTVMVMPIAAVGAEATAMAANVTTRLADGLAKIGNLRVEAAPPDRARTTQADFVVTAELQKNGRTWEVNARMTRAATGNVEWAAPVSIATDDSELPIQQSRLAAGIGHPLALRINALVDSDSRPVTAANAVSPAGRTRVAIEQAAASIMQTTRARFANAQTMLEKALADDPDNVDLAVGLAALQLRGVQMVWYTPEESAAAEASARSTLERALRIKPNSIPVLEAYCRFLSATNQFVESLVTCAKALNFDPWNGLAIYHIGLAQVQLGRFEDALASFKLADSFDTPRVSRWTWQLGVGMTYLVMGRSKEALPWLQRSIAITPASGRSYMLLSAAYEGLGQTAEAKAAMAKALALRPGSNAGNITLPAKNASQTFLASMESIKRANIAAGLPEN